MNEHNSPPDHEDTRPLAASCRRLDPLEPLRWLRAGWIDLRRSGWIGAAYGAAIVVLSLGVSGLAWWLGSYVLLFAMLLGFVFIAPLLAVGLYAVSRHLAAGRRVTLSRCLREMRRAWGQAAIFALVLLVIFLVWARAGSMVHVFFPMEQNAGWLPLLRFLAIGTVVGSIFALVVFACAAFSLPMVADRDVDMITAVITSINAVLRNRAAMAVWLAIIVALTAIGLATATLGLGLVVPWLGYATWHGYVRTIDASEWSQVPLGADTH